MSEDCYASDTIGELSDQLKECEEFISTLKDEIEELRIGVEFSEKRNTIRANRIVELEQQNRELQQIIELQKGVIESSKVS